MQFSTLAASLLVLATLASASTECLWGQLYWCQSQEKAERCGKLEYCQENFWSTSTDEGGTLCDICEALLAVAHNYLEKNATSGETELVLDEFCTYLDVEVLVDECQHIVNEYFPKIWKLLEDGTDPKTICPMFFSDCPQSHLTEMAPLPPSNDAICEVCVITAKEIHNYVERSKTEEEVKAAVEEVCKEYPELEEACREALKNWTETWNEVKHDVNSRLCYDLGVCGEGPSQLLQVDDVMKMTRISLFQIAETPLKPMADAICTLCVDLAEYLYNWTLNDTVKDIYHKAVIEVCKEEPGEEQCKKALANFTKYWEEEVQDRLHNGKECYGYEEVCKKQPPAPQTRERKEAPLPPSNDAICEACLITAKEMHKYILRNKTEREVKAALEEVCQEYPQVQEYCKEFLKNWTKTWDEVKRHLYNSHVCYEEEVCPGPDQPRQVNIVLRMMKTNLLKVRETKMKPMADAICTLCLDLAEYLYNWALNDTVQDIFHKAVIEDCKKEPGAPYCKEGLANFTKYWKEQVLDKLHNGKVCYAYEEVCSKQPSLPQIRVRKEAPLPPSNNAFCDACVVIAKEMHTFTLRNKSEEVKAAFEEVCQEYPNLQDLCKEFLKNWTKTWDEVKHSLYNGHYCYETSYCYGSLDRPHQVNIVLKMMKTNLLKVRETEMKPMADAICTLCLDLAEYLYNQWALNDTVKEILRKAFIEFCRLEPGEPYCGDVLGNFTKFWKEQVLDQLHNGKVCYEDVCGEQPSLLQIRTRKEAPLPPSNDAICDACLITAKEIEKFVNRNKTEGEVKAAVKEVCNDYPDLLSLVCEDIFDNWTDTWDAVKRILAKGRVCYDEVCNEEPGQPLQVNMVMKVMRISVLKIKETKMKPMADAICTLCVDLADFLYTWTLNDTVRDTFHKAVMEYCKREPPIPDCKEALANFTKFWKEKVVDQLHNGKECYGYEEVCGEQPTLPQIRAPLPPPNDAICDACLITGRELLKFLNQNKSESEVKAAVEEACKKYPDIGDYCHTALKNWTKTWDELRRGLQTGRDCYEGICAGTSNQPLQGNVVMKMVRIGPLRGNEMKPMIDAVCKLCVDLAKYLYNWTFNDTVKDIFHKAVLEECKEDPEETPCKEAQTNFTKFWKEQVQDRLHNGKGCYEEACEIQAPAPRIRAKKKALSSPPNDALCEACLMSSQKIYQFIVQNKTSKGQVKSAVEEVCEEFPEMKEDCKALLKNWTETWNKLKDNLHSNYVCYNFWTLCKRAPGQSLEGNVMKMLRMSLLKRSEMKMKPTADPLCALCVHLAEYLYNWSLNDTVRDIFHQAIIENCKSHPEEEECKEALANFTKYWEGVQEGLHNGKECYEYQEACFGQAPLPQIRGKKEQPNVFNGLSTG